MTDFAFYRVGQSLIWIDREFAQQSLLERFADPDRLLAQADCEIVKDQEKTKIGSLELMLGDQRRRIFIKRYNVPSWRHRIGSLVIASGALRALRGAVILNTAGIRTARPIAAVEQRRCGMLRGSFYLSEDIPAGSISSQYWSEHLRRLTGASGIVLRQRFVVGLAKLFAQLHEQKIYHNDLKDFNILIEMDEAAQEPRFFLLDLEGVRRSANVGRRRQIKNLVQINRSLGKLLSAAQRMRFLKFYRGADFKDRVATKRLARAILVQSRKLDRQKLELLRSFV